MAKAIICGADLVAVDTALLVALGCRVCRDAERRMPAATARPRLAIAGARGVRRPADGQSDGRLALQLIEVLGAMGIREVRRLRGEVGRAIFMEDIEREAFGDLAREPRAQVNA